MNCNIIKDYVLFILFWGEFMNHVDMSGEGDLPNVHITTQVLFTKIVRKKGRGVNNVQKSVHTVYE